MKHRGDVRTRRHRTRHSSDFSSALRTSRFGETLEDVPARNATKLVVSRVPKCQPVVNENRQHERRRDQDRVHHPLRDVPKMQFQRWRRFPGSETNPHRDRRRIVQSGNRPKLRGTIVKPTGKTGCSDSSTEHQRYRNRNQHPRRPRHAAADGLTRSGGWFHHSYPIILCTWGPRNVLGDNVDRTHNPTKMGSGRVREL
jgi:hypothetical protein